MLDCTYKRSKASFRDPDGFVFQTGDLWYRYVSKAYQPHYDHLINSGLYERLIEENCLIPHQEVDLDQKWTVAPYKILKPQLIEDITFPYEWSFSQLKEAALITLKIQRIAQAYGMALKDACAYNIQIFQGQPVLIDTLSFIKHDGCSPWLALGQFYRHFVWPLLAMSQMDVSMNRWFQFYPDGFKIEMIKPYFRFKSWFKLNTLIHVHLHHYMAQKSNAKPKSKEQPPRLKPQALNMILLQIQKLIEKCDVKQKTVWHDYYAQTNYNEHAFGQKEAYVKNYISKHQGRTFIDFGANNGHFSQFAKNHAHKIYALDIDPMSIDQLYRQLNQQTKSKIIPLIADLSNPTPGVGWKNEEHPNLLSRLPQKSVGLVLALIHHLHISHNIKFEQQAAFFSQFCSDLCIEYIHIKDSQVQRLLNNRYDTPADYSHEAFEAAFSQHFEIIDQHIIVDADRSLYQLKKRR